MVSLLGDGRDFYVFGHHQDFHPFRFPPQLRHDLLKAAENLGDEHAIDAYGYYRLT